MSWAAIIGAIFEGYSNRQQQRAEDDRLERAAEQGLINMRERGDEDRRTSMFQSDLSEYERSRDRERKRGGLENYIQFGKKPDGSNRWGFMDNYTPVNNNRETPSRPNYEDYAVGPSLDSLTSDQRRQYDRWMEEARRRNSGGGG